MSTEKWAERPLFYFAVQLSMLNLEARVEKLVREAVEAEGFELVQVQAELRGGSPQVLRIYIDKPGGVSISDCADVSRQIGVLLDVEDFIPVRYVLEVSSPGIERPLFQEADYVRFKGKEVRLTTIEKIENRRNFVGLIRNFSNGVVDLDCDGKLYSLPFEKIKKANLVYRFN